MKIIKRANRDFIIHDKVEYEKSWCCTCGCYTIKCPSCGNTSCNGGGCIYCEDAFKIYINIMNNFNPKEFKEHYNKLQVEFVTDAIKETEELILQSGSEGTLIHRLKTLNEIMERLDG